MSTSPLQAAAAVLEAAGVGARSRLCCALSGGVDSIVLLDLLAGLQSRFGHALCAAHVNHGLNPAASAWQAHCTALCSHRGIPFIAFTVDVARDDHEGLESAARKARHAVLETVECDWLVFGHHRDDQAETVLFRLFRGTGLRGASAMVAVEPGAEGRAGRLRPMLGFGRADIRDWAHAHALTWVEDDSNTDCRFARNDIRHRILPAIETAYPSASASIARAAAHFREASDLLDELAASDEHACGGRMLRRDGVLALSDARVANLLRWQARRCGMPAPSRARLLEALRQLRAAPAVRPLYFPLGDLACCAYRGEVWLESVGGGLPAPCHWGGTAAVEKPWGDGRVVFSAAKGRGIARAALDQAAKLSLVTRSAGLRMRLAPERPSRTFKNLCQEAGIPAWMRDRLPVLEVDGSVAWIGGIGIDAAFACPPGDEGFVPEWVPVSS
ncbi:tRNA lysidine(34) synthetase TilS [Parazoarcus communis]|uniref:tRNA(Ile)-lysidine synthase n=1 Tax=Parazoarcus communis TaxID=41977 RepID=A0A2U8H8A5_9RHOO|nr:tRNA lysidine(34) synthetase TilS [Parazoarcus communis]